jgi:hypothetical protein
MLLVTGSSSGEPQGAPPADATAQKQPGMYKCIRIYVLSVYTAV